MTAPTTSPRPAHAASGTGTGIAFSLGAYGIWGTIPLYFHMLLAVPPLEVVAGRTLFSLPLAFALAAALGQLRQVGAALARPRIVAPLCLSAALILANWTVYIMAIQQGHVLASSLGYYINPLLNVLIGTVFLRERLSRRQWFAISLAGVAVAILAWGARDMLWISLTLATTFALYGLVRKLAPVTALPGLAVETVVLAPVAMGYVWWHGPGLLLGHDAGITLLLAGAGLITVLPLYCFAEAARRLDLSTLGILQYIAPSMIFLVGVFVYREPLRPVQMVCFALIWAGIALYVWDLVARHRARRVAA